MVDSGVLHRRAARAVGQRNGVLGVDERLGEVFDGLDGEPSGAEGRDVLDDVRCIEPGPAGAEPFLRFDEGVDEVVPLQPGSQHGNGPAADLGFEGVAGGHPDPVHLSLPPFPEHLGGEGAVKPPRVEAEAMRFLSHDEVAALAAAIDPRYRALVLLAAYSGLRAGELAALRRKHVDLLRRTVTVVEQVQRIGGEFVVLPPKSAAGRRSVALPTLVATALQEHLAAFGEPGPEGLVFAAPGGGFLRPENFRNRCWLPAVKTAGVAPLRLHDLRHTCASLAIAAGADVKVLQRMLGHASAALTLDRYGHLMPGQERSVADRLDEMARRAVPTPIAPVASLRS